MKRLSLVILGWFTCAAASLGFSQDGGSDEAQAVYILASVTAAPGETVRVPLSVWSNREIQWLVCSVRFDETVLEPVGFEEVWKRPDGEPWGFSAVFAEPFPCPVEKPGWAVFAAIISFENPGRPFVTTPAGAEIHLVNLIFRVLPDAKAGVTALRFEDYDSGVYRNWAGLRMDEYELSFPEFGGEGTAASVLLSGSVRVTAERAFRRGDANADGTVDLSDAVSTLSYLFEGQGRALCEDALDANDDGALDISDPITTLGYLFLGGPPLAAPSSGCGHDVPQDDLSCAQYAACP